MHDRFKFRVWNEKHGRYIQDNEYPIGGDYSLSMTQYGYVEVIGFGDYQEGSDTTYSWGRVKNIREYIGECIIEQCTGLKDKNGNLIYEGDIVSVALSDGSKFKHIIRWYDGKFIADYGWYYHKELEDYCSISQEFMSKKEIVGNIHENPELLEQSNDD